METGRTQVQLQRRTRVLCPEKMNANTSLFFPTEESIKQAQVPKTRVLCQMKTNADTRRFFPLRQGERNRTIPNTRVLC